MLTIIITDNNKQSYRLSIMINSWNKWSIEHITSRIISNQKNTGIWLNNSQEKDRKGIFATWNGSDGLRSTATLQCQGVIPNKRLLRPVRIYSKCSQCFIICKSCPCNVHVYILYHLISTYPTTCGITFLVICGIIFFVNP